MQLESLRVGLLRCAAYRRVALTEAIATLCHDLAFVVRPGTRILLKPNLISGRQGPGPACTHPEFVAAVAAWLLDHGATVTVGDSPAFGTGPGVMKAIGLSRALHGMPVRVADFQRTTPQRLTSGITVSLATAALECDVLVNLPKVKAHSQFYLSLAVKNYFGLVSGLQKPWFHLRYGGDNNRLPGLLVDLLALLGPGISLADGIETMHRSGPTRGEPFALNVIAGATNPVALDTALVEVLGLNHATSPLWKAAVDRHLPGTRPETLEYPLLSPSACGTTAFHPPAHLLSMSFNPLRLTISILRRWLEARGDQGERSG